MRKTQAFKHKMLHLGHFWVCTDMTSGGLDYTEALTQNHADIVQTVLI